MKRIISALLVIVMLAAMITVPAVTASAWSAPSSYDETDDLYNTDLPMRYAINGTATIDGDKSEWGNAYTYRVDRSQNGLIGGGAPMGTMADIYMMWDDNYLYILEERFYETITRTQADVDDKSIYYNFAQQGSAHCVVLPSKYTDDSSTTNNGGTAMVYTIPGLVNKTSPTLDTYINGRIKWYTNSTLSTAQAVITPGPVAKGENYAAFTGNDVTAWTGSGENDAKAQSKTTLTETGYFMETAIPWDFLDQRCSQAFSPAGGTIIGIALNISRGGANTYFQSIQGGDTKGFQQLTLLAKDVPNPTVKPICPDISWYDISDPDFTITTAAQLLGLCELTNIHSSYAQWFENNPKIGTADYKALTRGKTFKLGADIVFNDGTIFKSDGTYTGNDPVNGWGGIGGLSGGTIDGGGYTVYGLYAPKGLVNGSKPSDFGFVGRLSVGSTVKNIKLKNGYLASTDDNIGSVAGIVSGSDGNGTAVVLSNIYSNVHVKGGETASKTGGIAGSSYTSKKDDSHTVFYDNVVYEGTVTTPTGTTEGWLSSRSWGGKVGSAGEHFLVYVKDCTSTSDKPMFVGQANVYTDVSDPKAYIQNSAIENETFAVRIFGVIDEEELALDNIGMKVTVSVNYYDEAKEDREASKSMTTETVYTSVLAAGEPVSVYEDLYYDYAYGVVIEGLPAAAGDSVTVTVQLTQNGENYGKTYTETYTQDPPEVETETETEA